jgi:hypothetical protein
VVVSVRVLDDDRVVREVVLRSLPATLGRGPECDVVLTSAATSRLHARLERDESGVVVLSDAGGRNGVWLDDRRIDRFAIAGSRRARLGSSVVEIEVVAADAATLEMTPLAQVAERRRGPAFHAAALGAIGLALATSFALEPGFWSPWNKTRGVSLVGAVLGGVILGIVMALGLFVVYKALGRRVRVADALGALAWTAWLSPAAALAAYGLYYVTQPATLVTLKGWIDAVPAIASFTILAGVRRPLRSRGFTAAVAAAETVAYLTYGWISSQTAARTGQPARDFAVQPPLGSWTGPTSSLDDLWTDVASASDRATKNAARVAAIQAP